MADDAAFVQAEQIADRLIVAHGLDPDVRSTLSVVLKGELIVAEDRGTKRVLEAVQRIADSAWRAGS